MTEVPAADSVVLAGGIDDRGVAIDTLIQFKQARDGQVTNHQLSRHLKTPRYSHIAMMVPDSKVICTP